MVAPDGVHVTKEGRDRGQLVLITALVLAATFVGLALVLNTVIFTENLAYRQTSSELDQGHRYHAALNESVTEALGTVNENPVNSSHATLRANLSETIENKMVIYQRDATIGGASITISVDEATGGYLLKQTDRSHDFTAGGDNDGATDWTLATKNSGPRPFQANLTRKSLFEATVDTSLATLANNAFQVTVANDTTTWEVYLFQDPLMNNVHIIADDPDSPLPDSGVLANQLQGSCSYDADFVRVDFERGTVNGNDCDELSFYANITGEYSISYNNTETTVPGVVGGTEYDRAAGTYQLLVTNESAATDNFYAVANSSSPYKVTAITDANVVLEHQTSTLWYRARLDVSAPSFGRYNPSGKRPTVSIDNVTDDTDTSSEDFNFSVTATASDPNADLDRLQFLITDDDGTEINSTNVTVSGGSATVTHRFQEEGVLLAFPDLDDDGNFTIQVTAYDDTGLSDSAAEKHKADGDGSTSGDETYPTYGGPDVASSTDGGDVTSSTDGGDVTSSTDGGDVSSSTDGATQPVSEAA